MNLLQRFQQLVTLIETALLSRYSNPEMYQQYVVESGRRELAQEVASVVRSSGDKINSTKLRVLDVAAGTGLVSQALLQEDCSVMAFDHSAEMLEALKEQFKGITTQVGDMNQPWPFADESFDAVTIVWGQSLHCRSRSIFPRGFSCS
jgi:2-polyprenyl-3-methyl-5-hydroxy-6-metoxy-1,4-benzoquinol methylase